MWNSLKILKNRWVNNQNNLQVDENLQLDEKISAALDKISPPSCLIPIPPPSLSVKTITS